MFRVFVSSWFGQDLLGNGVSSVVHGDNSESGSPHPAVHLRVKATPSHSLDPSSGETEAGFTVVLHGPRRRKPRGTGGRALLAGFWPKESSLTETRTLGADETGAPQRYFLDEGR
ncbi:hypothetical protein CSUB01_09613 [Colletotrichum sublineola]|uniref:Uncharacterized protein n=1 Tax=Colletotrichum sublineola TaxID=1173701 RepID=A0A066XKX0_COLSU|nr:hypothetical protein CSUB01_09613 [Colletotrichum sublineola]